MSSVWRSRLAATVRRAKGDPFSVAMGGLGAIAVFYVIAVPFLVSKYPPIIDLPFHAAQTSILRHYLDAEYHFREQFSLHPIEVPYLSMYGIGALLALVFPIHVAAKLMAMSMLLLLPAGLAVLFWGMRKNPLLGLLALGLVWCTLTHWGFLNFMGAIGLFAMSIGFAMRVLDRPRRRYQWALGITLASIFFTHIYRVPFAILAVVVTGALLYPATRRFRPLLAPVLPTLLLFGVWFFTREASPITGAAPGGLDLSFDRLAEIPKHLFGAYLPPDPAPATPVGDEERAIATQLLAVAGAVLIVSTALFFVEGRGQGRTPRERCFALGATAVPLVMALALLVAYLVLPMQIGLWWYVYPREIVTGIFILLAVVPDLPGARWHRALVLLLIVAGAARMSTFVADRWSRFDRLTADFDAIKEHIPQAPKLFYLVYARGGTLRRVSPFLHLPAWIQAEKGGALAFHFVIWNHSPIRYREAAAAVPPKLPERFEWTPQHFRVLEHGRWFDTFLVRHTIDPGVLFEPDPSIRFVAREGTWWLYRRAE